MPPCERVPRARVNLLPSMAVTFPYFTIRDVLADDEAEVTADAAASANAQGTAENVITTAPRRATVFTVFFIAIRPFGFCLLQQ